MKQAIMAAGLVAVIAVVAGAFWLSRQFVVPDTEEIPSLAGHLDAQSVLAVFAHPDDEIMAAGTLAEAAARENTIVRTVTATRGEAGIPEGPVCRPEDLAVIRHAELLKYGYLLGLAQQVVWEYPDGDLSDSAEAVTRDLVREIRSQKPDLLITFDPASGYSWHPDHLAIGRAATEALRLASRPIFEPKLGPPHQARWLAYFLVPPRVMRVFGGERGRKVAAHQAPIQYSVPIDRTLKIRGWSIHESQYGHLRRVWGVPPWLLYLFFDNEHFAVQEGDPSENRIQRTSTSARHAPSWGSRP